MTKVDINISGKTYPINCPADELDELNAASNFINEFIENLRAQAPHLSHENLLVLCCLNLHEKINAQEKHEKLLAEDNKQTEALLDKLIADAQAMI